ncbi:nitroreductase family protein [Caloranaerobacter azorensis]|uniref:Nitroreductase family protein n=1 Tax=Caloranaerobacter azorensis TaxID=116090 RepID=A0A6P1YH38_9FIRM|nr:nitroreductase family protein [Caloranaerobacter azorensis]QIB28028.1 nitroreductase family protein [Caloranaerobacter azorensis]
MEKLDFIYKRHSVRKFKDIDVPIEDIKEIIKAGTYAPSGKNLQNWHFVVVKNKEKIEEMARIVERKNAELANYAKDEDTKKSFTKYLKYHTVFRNAPVVILVYAGPYPSTGLELLKEKGASKEELDAVILPNPGIQNIAAAMENILLAASSMGYGTCWMTGPNYASREITDYIGFKKEGYFLAAMTPLGIPEEFELKSPPRKPLEEVMTIIE